MRSLELFLEESVSAAVSAAREVVASAAREVVASAAREVVASAARPGESRHWSLGPPGFGAALRVSSYEVGDSVGRGTGVWAWRAEVFVPDVVDPASPALRRGWRGTAGWREFDLALFEDLAGLVLPLASSVRRSLLELSRGGVDVLALAQEALAGDVMSS